MNVCSNCVYKSCCSTVRTHCDGRQTITEAKRHYKKAVENGNTKTATMYKQIIDKFNR